MTKKHFIALANLIKDKPNLFSPDAIDALAEFSLTQNPRFDKPKWIRYICGIKATPKSTKNLKRCSRNHPSHNPTT